MVFKIDYAGAVFFLRGGDGSIMLATTKTKGGSVSKKVYIIYKIRSIRGFKSTDSK